MKINSVNSFKPSFGHISKQAVDTVRRHAEGYCGNPSSYSTDTKYKSMGSDELKRMESLVKRASVLDNSWIHSEPNEGLFVQFYKDCEPSQKYDFDSKEEGNASASLDILESAVNVAESAEGAEVDESKEPSGIWNRMLFEIKKVAHRPDRFKSDEDNKTLEKIYDNSFLITDLPDESYYY